MRLNALAPAEDDDRGEVGGELAAGESGEDGLRKSEEGWREVEGEVDGDQLSLEGEFGEGGSIVSEGCVRGK